MLQQSNIILAPYMVHHTCIVISYSELDANYTVFCGRIKDELISSYTRVCMNKGWYRLFDFDITSLPYINIFKASDDSIPHHRPEQCYGFLVDNL